MSPFGPPWYPPARKRPPPERGIKMKKAGSTWWGQRWIEALQTVLGGQSGRLARGRTYARAGRTHDLVVHAGGKVTAQVTGSRPTPYAIALELTPLGEAAWSKAIEGMAKKAQFAAELLAGRMPHEIDQLFQEAGASLFPRTRADLRTSCSCPDWGDPCKHVAATHYVLGEALDRDPFLLFELRGRSKAQVLAALAAARGATGAPPKARATPPAKVQTVRLGKLAAGDYDRPRSALPALHLRFEAPADGGALLRQLGAPAAWEGEASPAELLAPLVHAAAEAARRLALAEPREPAVPAPPTEPRRRPPRARRRS